MNLYQLNNSELDNKIKTLAQKERELLHEVLLHICEADHRRLYLDLAYPSLFSYLTESCGYSVAAAQRRIDAARLIPSVPVVLEKIKTGEISLSQISLLQKSIREKYKLSGERLLPEQRLEIINNLCFKSMSESQKIIAEFLDLTLQVSPKETYQKDGSVRLEVSFTKEEWQNLLKARELLSHAVGSNDWGKLFLYLGKKVVQKSENTKAKVATKVKVTTNPIEPASTSAAEVVVRQKSASSIRKSIPTNIRRKIYNRDQCCQYQDKITGKVCGSRWGLEIDHIQPLWANGTNDETNLRILCGEHNRYFYQKQAGIYPG